MRRTLLLAVLAAQAAIPAHAATHATVVARPSRAVAVVALTDGTLTRVRLPRGTAAAVGRQVDIVGKRDKFGTLVARIVRPAGKAGRFRIAGTVVGRDGTAVLVASGGAVARLVASPLPVVGSGVRATVRLRSGIVVAERVFRRGAPGRLQLAGVVSAIGAGVVAMRLPGGANIAVGSGRRDISWLKPGDPVVLDSTRRGAQFVLRRYALLTGRDAFSERRRGEVIGQVGNVDGASLLVTQPGRPDTRVALESPSAAAGARNGDTVIVDRRAAGDPTAAHVIVLGRAVAAAPPVVELRSAPPATTPATTVVIEWAARGSVARQLCSLDGAAWIACTSPRVVAGLSRGAHVVAIAAGNNAGWAPRTDVRFTVDPPPPAAPVVTITGGAPPIGYATSASFPFTVTGSALSVLCSLDGAPWTACTSPRAASSLGVGAHVFAVTAGNAGGWNIAERRFAVVATPTVPTVTLTQQPAASTTSTSAVFAWTTTGTLDATECRVDAGTYTACASPLALNGLALGGHSLDVRVSNAGGTGLAAAAWTIVAPPPGAPTVTITSAPSGTTTATAASVAFSTTGSGVTTTCSLDGAAAAACTSPGTYAALALGAHQVAVVATNGGGSATATAAWTVVPAPPGVTITSAPAATVTVATATVTWTTTGTVTATSCSLDGGPFTPCTSPASWTGLGVGAHSVVVRASNAGGATDATVSWTIAVAAPTVAISSAPPATTSATSATIAWVTSGTVTTTTCSLDGGAFSACAAPAVLTGLVTGGHLYTVKVANAGGYATASAAWSITTAPPPPAPPANTVLPVISGVAQSRKTVTATTGTWTGSPDTFTFQWLRCTNATSVATCTTIAGATAAAYTAATADIDTYLRVQVTAANAGGSVTAVSAATPKTMPS